MLGSMEGARWGREADEAVGRRRHGRGMKPSEPTEPSSSALREGRERWMIGSGRQWPVSRGAADFGRGCSIRISLGCSMAGRRRMGCLTNAMDFVEGEPYRQFCAANDLTVRESWRCSRGLRRGRGTHAQGDRASRSEARIFWCRLTVRRSAGFWDCEGFGFWSSDADDDQMETPYYASPERFAAGRSHSRAIFYSLGCFYMRC